jgi:uncharacterized protein (DUF934 family)
MADIIKDRQVVTDTWQLLKPAADKSLPAVPSDGDVIVPLAQWLAQRAALSARGGRLGVWLGSQDDPAIIVADFAHFAVIAVNFPQFVDGQGYSIARLLRERYHWQGELRAVGDVFRETLFYQSRCGFNAFALRGGEDAHAALSALDDFSEAYQTSVERPQPMFRRRLAQGATRV